MNNRPQESPFLSLVQLPGAGFKKKGWLAYTLVAGYAGHWMATGLYREVDLHFQKLQK